LAVNSKWRAYFELLRFPAVFTAIADVMMGFLVTFGALHPGGPFVMLAAASALLYLAGMVLNDVFDAETDAEERPQRPIPSQRVRLRTAKILGWSLLALGVLTAAHLGYHGNSMRTTLVALTLAACVVLYDAGAKRTLAGSPVMGSCRMLNVLLGMSLAAAADRMSARPWSTSELMLAAGLGVYIVGVSVFARSEAGVSLRRSLAAGIAVLFAGLGLIASAPIVGGAADQAIQPGLKLSSAQWLILWGLLATVIVRRCLLAWRSPSPGLVQQAVRTCLRSIIVIDAAIVLGYCGPFWGCMVLALLVPMLLLEQWVSTT
jgi:4-hydroxybenzoate polyprenyltransferase